MHQVRGAQAGPDWLDSALRCPYKHFFQGQSGGHGSAARFVVGLLLAKRRRIMANPKRKHSHSRSRLRRANDRLRHKSPGTCPKCGSPKQAHQICGYCGYYRGVTVIQMEPEGE
ncbi:MAG: 50S ribosomal protein L32 [Planctomycetota bacterium]|nr:50S ribosomal protein L32 [Planctomycetota bacterium]